MKSLRDEANRLATFNGWPSGSAVQPRDLARNGFFYMGIDDKVKCAFCGVIFEKWIDGDIPEVEHQRHSPSCDIVRGLDVYNIHDGSRLSQSNFSPEYNAAANRLQSYSRWPTGKSQTPLDLARAGFFYTGDSDHVRCFVCGVGLRNWEANEDPFLEHKRWSPKCDYISPSCDTYSFQRTTTGDGEHRYETQRNDVTWERLECFPSYRDPDKRLESFKAIHLLDINPRKHAAAGFFYDSTSDSVRCFCCGLALTPKNRDEENLLDLHARRSSNCPYISNPQGACQCLGLELKNDLPRDQVLHLLQQVTESTVKGQRVTEAAGGVPFSLHDRRPDPEFLAAENRVLRERMQCRVCHNNHVNIVFLPCGHLVCCSECASIYSQCPECQRLVLARKKVAFE